MSRKRDGGQGNDQSPSRSRSRSKSRSRSRSCSARSNRSIRTRSGSRGGRPFRYGRRGGYIRRGRSRSRSRSRPGASRSRSGSGRSRSRSEAFNRRGRRRRSRSRFGGQRGRRHGGDRGNWDCPHCNWLNYSHRDKCQKCSTLRPRSQDRKDLPPLPGAQDGAYPSHSSSYAPGYYGPSYAHHQAGQYYQHHRRRDYADERPEAYNAFLRHVRYCPDGGLEVSLCDRMCLDHHVADLLMCMEAWMSRDFGPPAVSGQPWRLGRLDLARNGLSDDSLTKVLQRLRHLDIRIRRLDLDLNLLGPSAAQALVEYLWNCPEAMAEISAQDNRIDRAQGAAEGDDAVSQLLRCVFNHPGYPRKIQASDSSSKILIVPLILRLGGNPIGACTNIIDAVTEKAGRDRVRFCSSADPYACETEEFLSIFMPDLNKAPAPPIATAAPPKAPLALTGTQQEASSSSCDEDSGAEGGAASAAKDDGYGAVDEVPQENVAADTQASDAADGVVKERRRKRRRVQRPLDESLAAEDDTGGGQGGDNGIQEANGIAETEASVAEAASEVPEANGVEEKPPASTNRKKRRRTASETAAKAMMRGEDDTFGDAVEESLGEDEQKQLQEDIISELSRSPDLTLDQEAKAMIAEFVVCMLLDKKRPSEARSELKNFLGSSSKAAKFVAWLHGHLGKVKSDLAIP
eukprot:TRINITY_DN12847_c0_g1_i4.p1 TRINITY_DN12847_c0_g1~~TRINITY_DN12847_c0_g1_i4.p1  ORF type:complete len:686 (-),score=110.38 TRINITY_DN12847_c0_g1_i4:94-2151(-)